MNQINNIRVCFLGCGQYAKKEYFPWINKPENNCEVVGISLLKNEPSKEEEEFFVKDREEMISCRKPDIAIVTTPNNFHYENVKFCLEKDLHILVDKPLACNPSEAKELIEISEYKNKLLVVGLERRYDQLYVKAKKIIQQGTIGELQKVTAQYHRDVDPLFEKSWRNDMELSGGGVLMDSGSHIIDVILWISNLELERISACKISNGNIEDINVDQHAELKCEFHNGKIGEFNFDYHDEIKGIKEETITFEGTKGHLCIVNRKINATRERFLDINGYQQIFNEANAAVKPLDDLIEALNTGCSSTVSPKSTVPAIELISKVYNQYQKVAKF